MKKYIYFLFLLSFGSVLLMSNRAGRAYSGGLGSTGAPGDDATTCLNCHNGPINVSLDIFVLDGKDTVKTYTPDKEYEVKVRVNHVSGNVPSAYGFQLLSLHAPLKKTGTDNKSWIPISANARTFTPRNGRMYVEHIDRSSSNLFEMKWTAPKAGTGAVSFYAAGNGVNSNNNFSGDGSAKISLELQEKTGTYVVNMDQRNNLRILPNPVQDLAFIEGDLSDVHHIALHNLLGRILLSQEVSTSSRTIDLSSYADGIYFVQFIAKDGTTIRTSKISKRSIKA